MVFRDGCAAAGARVVGGSKPLAPVFVQDFTMAITRRTAAFRVLAESLDSCLDIADRPAEPAEVDHVLNLFLEERGRQMGIKPRSVLVYLSPEISLGMAQDIATWFQRGVPRDETVTAWSAIGLGDKQWHDGTGVGS